MDYQQETKERAEEIKRKAIQLIRANDDLESLKELSKLRTGEKIWRFYSTMTGFISNEDIAKLLEQYFLGETNTRKMESVLRSFKFFQQ